MKVSKLQAILSIIIVTVFTLVTAIIALTPVIAGYPISPFKEHLKDWSSMYSGIIGILVGYHFPKKD